MIRTVAALACMSTLAATLAQAPPLHKAGLWEMKVQLSRMDSTPSSPPMDQPIVTPATSSSSLHFLASSADSGSPERKVCMTPDAAAKYGAPFFRGFGKCTVSNIRMDANGMSGELVCTGNHTGKGTVTLSWKDASHAKGTTTFAGDFTVPGQSKSEMWKADYTASYVGPDCGKARPYLQ
jgi:hypothetical protein